MMRALRSGTIRLNGSRVRAMWIATSDRSDALLSIDLYFSNATAYAVWGSAERGLPTMLLTNSHAQ